MELMPFSSDSAKNLAKSRKRDQSDHFVKNEQIKIKTSISTPTQTTINPEFEKPLLQVSVTNPLKKILYWLDQIRRRQTTTFAIKLSIPLIALPVIMFGAFQAGKYSVSIPFLVQTSPSPIPIPATSQVSPYSRTGILKIAKSDAKTTYLLGLKNGENIALDIPANINLTKYQNKQVLITGLYNRQANLLKVTDIARVDIYNEIPISATPSAAN